MPPLHSCCSKENSIIPCFLVTNANCLITFLAQLFFLFPPFVRSRRKPFLVIRLQNIDLKLEVIINNTISSHLYVNDSHARLQENVWEIRYFKAVSVLVQVLLWPLAGHEVRLWVTELNSSSAPVLK